MNLLVQHDPLSIILVMIAEVLLAVEFTLLVLMGFFLTYLLMLSCLSFFARRKKSSERVPKKRFAFVVPAHNEEAGIERTLKSLFAVDYPRNQFEVFVVADNCSDRTAEKASVYGAHVLQRTDDSRRGKGYALRWCFDQLLEFNLTLDAFVVVDADSVVSSNFLSVMNAYLCDGSEVTQSADLVEPTTGSWNSEVSRIALLLYNYVRPLGRKVIGCSAGLRGNGMCFSSDVLRRIPWNAHSITEDLEYGMHLLLRGVSVSFAPEARVYATMPQHEQHAESQRTRWEAGRFRAIRSYAWKLLWLAMTRRSFTALDAFIELLTPAFVNMMAIAACVIFVKLLASLGGFEEFSQRVGLWLGVFGLGIAYLIVGLRVARARGMLMKALLYFPRYILWKMKLYLKMLSTGRTTEWIRTTREMPGGGR
ncbi:MAG: glycosyltransferase family 2 protein [Ignavibacteriales bacterium]|nr:glycosyltransferase family 2 protein [Ignavibacteriales bacterium]